MNEKEKLNEELSKLNIVELSKIDMDELTISNTIYYSASREITKKQLESTFLDESEFILELVARSSLFSHRGITKDNVKKLNISDDGKDQIMFVLELTDIVFNDAQLHSNTVKKIILFESEHIGIQIDKRKLISVFYEYLLIREGLKLIKIRKSNYNEEINKIRQTFFYSLKTASIYLDFDFEAISAKSAYVRLGQKNSVELPITPEIIEVLKKAIEPYKELNETVFNGSISNKILVALTSYLFQFDESYLLNFPFTRLMSAINDKSKISHSALMLFFHDLLLHFNHPSAITEIDEERFDRLNVDSTIYSLNQKKIRVAERIVKF